MIALLMAGTWMLVCGGLLSVLLAGEYPVFSHLGTESTGTK